MTGLPLIELTVTALYIALLMWGAGVGVRLIWQAKRRPSSLLNPLFANPHALRLYTLHLVVATADLFVIGPLSIAHRSTLWYWGGRIALLSVSLPVAMYMNRNTESFGKLIGKWVVFRNVFEVGLHIAVASAAVNWAHYHLLLWWIVAYRFLDVGPRRLLRSLYGTPEKLATRPWGPTLNWAVIAALYVLAYLVVREGLILFAPVPEADLPPRESRPWEVATVVSLNLALTYVAWDLVRKYVASLLDDPQRAAPGPGRAEADFTPQAGAFHPQEP